jgi:hypothetical protein
MHARYTKIALFSCYLHALGSSNTKPNLQQLMTEFKQIGIYNPNNPGAYNERRAKELLKAIQEASSGSQARQLDLARLRSLEGRFATTQPDTVTTPTTTPIFAPGSELSRLQQENAQLRTHARHLQEENARLKHSATGTTGSNPELIRLRVELDSEKHKNARNETRIEQLQNRLDLLDTCPKKLDQFNRLSSRIITALSDFDTTIASAQYEYEESSKLFGLLTNEQRLHNAEQFIGQTRTALNKLEGLRNLLDQFFKA